MYIVIKAMETLFLTDVSNVCRDLLGTLALKSREAEAVGHGPWLEIVRSRLKQVDTWGDTEWTNCVVNPMINLSAVGIEAENKREAAETVCKDAFKMWAMANVSQTVPTSSFHLHSPTKFLRWLVTRLVQDADVTTGAFFDKDVEGQIKTIERCAKETLLRQCVKKVVSSPAVDAVAAAAPPLPTMAGGMGTNLLGQLDHLPHDSISTAGPPHALGHPLPPDSDEEEEEEEEGDEEGEEEVKEDEFGAPPQVAVSVASIGRPGDAKRTVLCPDVRSADDESTIILLKAED